MLVTPKRDRVAERREATRREILDAAWEIARENGLSALTLRDVAGRVGMRAPSLYGHFESKNAIYDAMFGQAWADYEESQRAALAALPGDPRASARIMARHFYDFATADLARHQLMDVRTIPGFEPSAQSYAPAVRVLENGFQFFRDRHIGTEDDLEIWIALIGGMVNQHHANDRDGNRHAALLDRAVDMWADAVGLSSDASLASPAIASTSARRNRR